MPAAVGNDIELPLISGGVKQWRSGRGRRQLSNHLARLTVMIRRTVALEITHRKCGLRNTATMSVNSGGEGTRFTHWLCDDFGEPWVHVSPRDQ